jgi:hypothetical protein
MATPSEISSESTDPYPDELVAAVVCEAEADADRVADFLIGLGFGPTGQKQICLSRDQLLFLGAVLRLNSWEEAGVPIHFSVGLGPASEILADAIRSAQHGKAAYPKDLSHMVHTLFVERAAWHARQDLGGVVELGCLDEETALDALAELLWHRQRAQRGEEE